MPKLALTGSQDATWYPVPVVRLVEFLEKVVVRGYGYGAVYALRRNIAYNLQYLEYLDRTLQDIKLSSVLTTQTWKTAIIVGCGIVESLLHYLLIKSDNHAKTEWELKVVMPGNTKKVDAEALKAEVHIWRKLSTPRITPMDFSSMIAKAQRHEVLGADTALYQELSRLRKLRNRVHLQVIDEPTDTDWNAFRLGDLEKVYEVLHAVLTGSMFNPSAAEREYFEYLRRFQGDP